MLFPVAILGCAEGAASSDPLPGPPARVLTSLSVSLARATIASGETTIATAVGRDQDGAIMSLDAVTWQVGLASVATISVDGVLQAAAVGSTNVQALSGTKAANATLTVTAGPAARLSVVRDAGLAIDGAPMGVQPQISVRDAYGNVRTSDNSTPVTAAVGEGATITGSFTSTTVNGVATFSGLGIRGTAGVNYAITFSSPGLTSTTSTVTLDAFNFGSGTKLVGTEVPAGRYRSNNSETASCYWERLSGFGGTTSEILGNEIGAGPAVVEIASTDRGFGSNGCARWYAVSGPVTPAPTSSFGEGTYVVGSDVAAGTWQSTGTGTSCYWARLRAFSGAGGAIIANFIGTAPAVVTISPGDLGFLSRRCGVWIKIS